MLPNLLLNFRGMTYLRLSLFMLFTCIFTLPRVVASSLRVHVPNLSLAFVITLMDRGVSSERLVGNFSVGPSQVAEVRFFSITHYKL